MSGENSRSSEQQVVRAADVVTMLVAARGDEAVREHVWTLLLKGAPALEQQRDMLAVVSSWLLRFIDEMFDELEQMRFETGESVADVLREAMREAATRRALAGD